MYLAQARHQVGKTPVWLPGAALVCQRPPVHSHPPACHQLIVILTVFTRPIFWVILHSFHPTNFTHPWLLVLFVGHWYLVAKFWLSMATNSVTLHFQLLIKATPIGICVIRNVTLIPPPTSIECQSLIWPTLTCAGDGCSLTIVNEIRENSQ